MQFLLILILHLDSFFTRVTEQLRERLQWFNNTIEVCFFLSLIVCVLSYLLTISPLNSFHIVFVLCLARS